MKTPKNSCVHHPDKDFESGFCRCRLRSGRGGVWRMLRNEAASEPFSCRTRPVPEGVSASPRKIFPAEQHLFRKDGVQQFRELK